MRAVRVTFTLRSPMVIPPGAKHLDALLSWAAVQQADFAQHASPWDAQHDIGVARHTAGDDWCFMAGALEIDWLGERDKLHYTKQQKVERYADAFMDGLLAKRPYFNGVSGSTKAGSYIEPIRWTRSVTGYAVVEDYQRFSELLPWITHIGKLHHKGFGAVKSFAVVDDEQANTKWMHRNLPAGTDLAGVSKTHATAMGALVSPYWKLEQHREVLAYVG